MTEHEQNLRDLFAGMAMIGLVNRLVLIPDALPPYERTATTAYHFADAMLRARDNTDEAPEHVGGTDD